MLAVLAGKLSARRKDCAPLAGKSTLSRLELAKAEPSRYHKISYDMAAIDALFVDLFIEAHRKPPKQIILDLDATDDLLHGHQEGRFFHGYYDCYCYLPLYIFCGRHLLLSRLRIDAAAVTESLECEPRRWKVVEHVREKFSCRDCEGIIEPPAPSHPIARGRAGPSLLAMILASKFLLHQPLNRQSEA